MALQRVAFTGKHTHTHADCLAAAAAAAMVAAGEHRDLPTNEQTGKRELGYRAPHRRTDGQCKSIDTKRVCAAAAGCSCCSLSVCLRGLSGSGSGAAAAESGQPTTPMQ